MTITPIPRESIQSAEAFASTFALIRAMNSLPIMAVAADRDNKSMNCLVAILSALLSNGCVGTSIVTLKRVDARKLLTARHQPIWQSILNLNPGSFKHGF